MHELLDHCRKEFSGDRFYVIYIIMERDRHLTVVEGGKCDLKTNTSLKATSGRRGGVRGPLLPERAGTKFPRRYGLLGRRVIRVGSIPRLMICRSSPQYI